MKKIIFLAATIAAIAACSKGIGSITPENGCHCSFEEGQQVTFTAGTSGLTKALNAYDSDAKTISFKWQADDSIKVSVESASSIFTVSKLIDDGASAEFTGTMPASGDNFDVQFPVTDPDLSTQTYCATEAIPHNMMKFTATGCTLGTDFSLAAANAVLKLNLYGTACKVKQIVVTNINATNNPGPLYILNFNESAAISSDSSSPTPFYIVVPAGNMRFLANVSGESTSATIHQYIVDADHNYGPGIQITAGSGITTSAKSFTAGVCLNMDAFSVTTTIWAPVNCGYEPANGEYKGYPYGKLYQWGRKDGQGYEDNDYEDATYPSGDNIVLGPISFIPTAADSEKFYIVTNAYYYGNWYYDYGVEPDKDFLWTEDGSSNYDPCPDGWRVPTIVEITSLFGNHISGKLQDGEIGSINEGMKGCYFDGSINKEPKSGVFLPAAGNRTYNYGHSGGRGLWLFYWSSSVDGYLAWVFGFDEEHGACIDYYGYRATGLSVRCVQK